MYFIVDDLRAKRTGIAARRCYAKSKRKRNAFAIRIQNGLLPNTSMTTRSFIHKY